jgi:3-methyladenine DNA glycosylase AlkD
MNVPTIRRIARAISRNQRLAEELWETADDDARKIAAMIADPALIAPETMDRWAADFDSWHLTDACSYDLFDRTPHAWAKVRQYAQDDREFVRRAAFAIVAALAIHDKTAPDRVFLDALPLIEQYAFDGRNFVRKAVNWALRNIGKRNAALLPSAIACAERVRAQGTASARWIAADALRELRPRQTTEVK